MRTVKPCACGRCGRTASRRRYAADCEYKDAIIAAKRQSAGRAPKRPYRYRATDARPVKGDLTPDEIDARITEALARSRSPQS